jgi:hypothetical protein
MVFPLHGIHRYCAGRQDGHPGIYRWTDAGSRHHVSRLSPMRLLKLMPISQWRFLHCLHRHHDPLTHRHGMLRINNPRILLDPRPTRP